MTDKEINLRSRLAEEIFEAERARQAAWMEKPLDKAEWLDLLHRCQDGFASCMYVANKIDHDMAPMHFMLRLAKEGGSIVSSDSCSVLEIAEARACGRFLIIDSFGFVLRAKTDQVKYEKPVRKIFDR